MAPYKMDLPKNGMIAAFMISVFIMRLLFVAKGIYPFGPETFVSSNMFDQYVPFLSEFQYRLRAGESLFYSWNMGMGENFAASHAYDLSSPSNWLLAL